jgi:hypothetical protein
MLIGQQRLKSTDFKVDLIWLKKWFRRKALRTVIYVPLFRATPIANFFRDWGCPIRRVALAQGGLSARTHVRPAPGAYRHPRGALVPFGLFCKYSAAPSRLRHRLALTRTGRGDGEDGRENPPVEPELSLRSVRLVRDSHQDDHFLATTFGLSSDATNRSVPLSRIMRSSPSVRGCRLGNPSRA